MSASSRLDALARLLAHARERLGLDIGFVLWGGRRVPGDLAPDALAIAIADEGAVAALIRRPNIDTLPALYMATSPQIRDAVKNLPETVRSALVIGHNPGLHEFATALAAPAPGKPDLTRLTEAFPTAALAEFLIPTAWHRLAFGTAALQRFLVPAGLV